MPAALHCERGYIKVATLWETSGSELGSGLLHLCGGGGSSLRSTRSRGLLFAGTVRKVSSNSSDAVATHILQNF